MDEVNNVKLEWPNHKNIFIENLWNAFSNQFLFDFEIVCEENAFGAHAVILSALCEIFSIKFNCDTSGDTSSKSAAANPPRGQFEINGINGELGKCFLEFIYRGKTNLPPDSLKPFLALLKQAQIRGLDELEVNYPAKDSLNARAEENLVTNNNVIVTPEVICLEEKPHDPPEVEPINLQENDATTNLFSSDQFNLDDISIIDNFPVDTDLNIEANLKAEELFDDVSTICRTTIEDVISVIENEKSKEFSFNGIYSTEKKISDDDTSHEKSFFEESVNSAAINELIISKATHFCECSFSVPTVKDRQVCSLSAVMRHCGCRLDEGQFSVSFSTNEDNSSNANEPSEQFSKCCLCSSELPISISKKPINSKEATKNLLSNYLDQMMNLSLPLDNDVEIITNPPSLRKDACLRSMLESTQPLRSSSYDNWRNSFSWKRAERNISHNNTSTQTDNNISTQLDDTISNQADDKMSIQASGLASEDEVSIEKMRCDLCRCELPGKAAFDLHMIAVHDCKLSPTRAIRKRLICSYCDFRAVSIRLLACHLTETHKGLVVPDESPTITGRVLRSARAQTNKSVSITPSPVKLEHKESESDSDNNEGNHVNKVEENHNSNVDDDLMIVEEKNKRDLQSKTVEKPSVKRKLNMKVKQVARKRPTVEALKTNGDEIVDQEPKTLKCGNCGFNTTSLFGLKCHRLEHTTHSPFQCETCNEDFVSKSALIMHMLNHATPEDYYKCGYCKFTTPFKTRIDIHVRQQHDVKIRFKCHFCKKLFNSRKACDTHRRIHYQQNSSLRKKPQLELPIKKKNVKIAKQFLCPKCDFIATESKLLYKHVYQNHLGKT